MKRYRAAYLHGLRKQVIGFILSGRTPEKLSWKFWPMDQLIWYWMKQAESDADKRADGEGSTEEKVGSTSP
jgi:hypothetical protein